MKLAMPAAAATAFLLTTASVFAAAGPGGACKEDREKFCKDVQPGQGRIVKCLAEHKAELSQACANMGAQMKASREKVHEACGDEIQQYCGDKAGDRQGMKNCLKLKLKAANNGDGQISDACKSALQDVKHQRQEQRAEVKEHKAKTVH